MSQSPSSSHSMDGDANTSPVAQQQQQQQQQQSPQSQSASQQSQSQSPSPPPQSASPSLQQQQQQQQQTQQLMQQQQQQPHSSPSLPGHFDIDEFEAAQQQLMAAQLGGAPNGLSLNMHAQALQMLHAQREQDHINAQANGMQMGGMALGGGIEICRAYLAGRCSRGAACRFVHVENTGGHTPPNPHLCRDWLNGTCQRGSGCRFQHQGLSGSKASIHAGASKSGPWAVKHNVICHQWASRGRCDYGTACKFSHQRGGEKAQWNESALDEKKLLAAMLSGLSPQEALSQALNSLQASNPAKFGPLDPNSAAAMQQSQAIINAANPMQLNSPTNGLDAALANAGLVNGLGAPVPQKRADGSLILCRFHARHGFCKYGVACKFYHQPSLNGAGMFPMGPNGLPQQMGVGVNGQGGGNQSLASLLALGLKASMMSQESLIANHAALLAANAMNNGSAANGQGVPRVASPPAQMQNGGANGMMALDPALASVLAAYLQNQQPMQQQQQQQQNPAASLASLLQQMQGGQQPQQGINSANPNSLSPTQQLNYGNFAGDSASNDAFNAFMQQQQQNAFNNAFSPAAASAFNAIPNLNTGSNGGNAAGNPNANAAGANASGSPNGSNGGVSNGNGNGNGGANSTLTLPQMISTAFRSSSNGSAGSSAGSGSSAGVSSLSNNLSLMSLKPFHDDSASFPSESAGGAQQELHGRSNSSSFNDASSTFSSPSLLATDARSPSNGGANAGYDSSSSSNSIIGGGMGGGHASASTLSALFSSSLSGPFLH